MAMQFPHQVVTDNRYGRYVGARVYGQFQFRLHAATFGCPMDAGYGDATIGDAARGAQADYRDRKRRAARRAALGRIARMALAEEGGLS